MGEASLRQMFVNSHACVHAHQWVLVVLLPPPLVKNPNTSPYLLRLPLLSEGKLFLMHIFIYIKVTLHPTRCCGEEENLSVSSGPWSCSRGQHVAPVHQHVHQHVHQYVTGTKDDFMHHNSLFLSLVHISSHGCSSKISGNRRFPVQPLGLGQASGACWSAFWSRSWQTKAF